MKKFPGLDCRKPDMTIIVVFHQLVSNENVKHSIVLSIIFLGFCVLLVSYFFRMGSDDDLRYHPRQGIQNLHQANQTVQKIF